VFLIVADAFANHLYAKEDEQGEGNPVVELLDEAVKVYRTCPSYQGHDGLEEAKAEGDSKEMAEGDALEYQSASDGYGETIHG
jgi:hypothetical protein